ncbi:MAG: pyridoxal phosphate-dependent aminotransferase family protein [Rhodobacterales bacterium]|nr:MAG: pyridoxal phosphate-dependent aminotransferase family protein [Rhodobacterales bacterium]
MFRHTPRPNRPNPQVQDLLTLGSDLPGPAAQRLQARGQSVLQTAALDEALSPFTPRSLGRSFSAQDPLGIVPPPAIAVSDPVHLLHTRLARLLQLPIALTFPAPDQAMRAALGTVLQPGDTVILDAACDSAMFETVWALQARPLRSPAASLAGVERRLRRLSASRGAGRIWVVVPAISPFASAMAEVADLADLCHEFGAGLIVDVTQGLGSIGQFGGGVMEVQGCLGRADVVLGSFARSFCAPGGFVGLRNPDLAHLLRRAQSRPIAPSHAATILAMLDLVESAEGQRRRRRLHAISLRLRNHLLADGVPVLGQPSPIVPVRLSRQTAPGCTTLMHSAGIGVSLVQRPSVASHAPRWCLNLSADHSPADIDSLADLIRDVIRSQTRR